MSLTDKNYSTGGLNLSWNILDFGVSYYTARQNGNKVIIANEQRRRTMHVLIQDIQTAYLRAATAQKMKSDLLALMTEAADALESSKKAEEKGLRSPIDALKYRKSLLENLKILETINQELGSAKVELNQLINLPANADYAFDDPDGIKPPNAYTNVNTKEFEVRAMHFKC